MRRLYVGVSLAWMPIFIFKLVVVVAFVLVVVVMAMSFFVREAGKKSIHRVFVMADPSV